MIHVIVAERMGRCNHHCHENYVDHCHKFRKGKKYVGFGALEHEEECLAIKRRKMKEKKEKKERADQRKKIREEKFRKLVKKITHFGKG